MSILEKKKSACPHNFSLWCSFIRNTGGSVDIFVHQHGWGRSVDVNELVIQRLLTSPVRIF